MSAKSKDTTKTAHVMNLLRKNTGSTQTAEPVVKQKPNAEQGEPIAVQPKAAPAQHPIIASLNEEAAVSQEIKDALEQELLDSEPAAPAPAAQPAPAEKPAPEKVEEAPVETAVEELIEKLVEEPVEEAFEELFAEPVDQPAEEAVPVPEPAQEPETMPQEESPAVIVEEKPVTEEPAAEEAAAEEAVPAAQEPAAKPASPVAAEEYERPVPVPNAEIFNVMQVLVEEHAEKYMRMFKVCPCPRCKADVRAIALNNLQPKYVVMGEGEYIPRMTAYERQFSTTVMAQVMRACTHVAQHPQHDDKL